jgi:hypothetical protein
MRSTHRWRDDDPDDDDDGEAMPLIELTGDLDREGTIDQLTEDESEPPRRRRSMLSLPRRYLVAGAAGLLAIGFAGGMVVQRASAPPPSDTATTASTTQIPVREPEFALPSPDASTCRFVDGYGAVGITTVCIGTLYSIHPIKHGWQLALALDNGATVGIEADEGTAVDGVPSLAAISVGTTLVVSGRAGRDGTLHATAITFA